MSGEIFGYVIIGIAVVIAAIGVWVLDAHRNKEVGQDPDRLDPDPHEVDPTDPLHRRH